MSLRVHRIRFAASWVFLALACSQHCVCQATLTVTGHVSTANGNPAPDMKIVAIPFEVGFTGSLRTATTDKNGSYSLQSPFFEKIRVIAYNESAGYPDTTGVLFTNKDEKFQFVEIGPDQSSVVVDIKLPPPDGILSGKVLDSSTGKAILQARITMRWAEDSEVMYSSYVKNDGEFAYALPARAITVEVTAPGYRPWRFTDSKTGSNSIALPLGSKTTVDVNLEPQ